MPNSQPNYLQQIEATLATITKSTDLTAQDKLAIASIEQAIQAAKMHNYPVGAIIVDQQQQILERNHNHVFNPYFNSMAHAEMITLNAFEKNNPTINYNGLALITSLEPCIMCYSRLLISKINTIYYVAKDWRHGAIAFSKQFPASYDIFKANKTFQQLECLTILQELASDIFFKHPNWDDGNYHHHQ